MTRRLRFASIAAIALAMSCGDKKAPSTTKSPNTPSSDAKGKPMNEMKPQPTTSFEDGHAVAPAADLIAWLEANKNRGGSDTTFRFPVVIAFTDEMKSSASRAYIGTGADGGGVGPDVEFDDTRMGIGMFDRLHDKVAGDAKSCVVWLEGHWGPKLKDTGVTPPPGANVDAHVIIVRKVGELITKPDPNAQVQVQK